VPGTILPNDSMSPQKIEGDSDLIQSNLVQSKLQRKDLAMQMTDPFRHLRKGQPSGLVAQVKAPGLSRLAPTR
jgi:hypothetical protein